MTSGKYKAVTISGKVAVGTSTLAKNLEKALAWKRINAGDIQREYDRKQGVDENKNGASLRSDSHEREVDEMTQKVLSKKSNIIYEGWLAGYIARDMPNVLRVLLICSDDSVRVDRVINRDGISVDEAKHWIKKREEENIEKWEKLYGNHDFWNPKSRFYDLVIDTYTMGPMETAGAVLDKLGFSN